MLMSHLFQVKSQVYICNNHTLSITDSLKGDWLF